MVAGIFCLFPLLCFCCNCYKVSTEKLYGLPEEDWQGMASVIQECRAVTNVRIWLQDNFINVKKTQILEKALQTVPVNRFTF
jgi:hypothetical protein